MKALVDTGNGLMEPISKKAVSLVGRDYFERQWEKEGKRKEFQPVRFRAIPYHAVGTQNGILHGYDMDRLINELTFYSKIDTNRIPYNFNRIDVEEYTAKHRPLPERLR